MQIPSFLIIPNDFKDCMPAKMVGMYIKKGIQSVIENASVTVIPMADGGPGTVETIIANLGGQIINVTASDPLLRQIPSFFGVLPDKNTAIIEMAAASGLEMLKYNERNPWITSTFGTGELIKEALNIGCKTIYIGLGGSATNDAGVGMAKALGMRFVDGLGNELPPGGGSLGNLAHIDFSGLDKRIFSTKIIALTDVSSTLTGKEGASFVFGPQKGANTKMVQLLDKNLHRFAEVVKSYTKTDITKISGGGAAGGLGAGLKVFLGADILPGFETMAGMISLEKYFKSTQIIITAEGKLDRQSLIGKTSGGVATLALKYNKPIIVFTGNAPDYFDLKNLGFYSIIPISKRPTTLAEAIKLSPIWLEQAAENFARLISFQMP